MELVNEIENSLEKEKNSFFETTVGKAVNVGIDIGIKALLPTYIEDQIIDVKNVMIENGLVEGIKDFSSKAIDTFNNIKGIITGNVKEIEQMNEIVKSNGVIDGLSDTLDNVLDKINPNSKVGDGVIEVIKGGKAVLLENVEGNLENTFEQQKKAINNIEESINEWKVQYTNENLELMENEYSKILQNLEIVMPEDSIINEINNISNINNIIKNNGSNFNLTEEQLQLAKILV